MHSKILIRIPGYSQAQVGEILDSLPMKHPGVSLAAMPSGGAPQMEPATVAIVIGSATLILREIIKSVTQLFIEHQKKSTGKAENRRIHIVVEMTIGKTQEGQISSKNELEDFVERLPSDAVEIRRITLE